MNVAARRVFSVQEERQAQYQALRKVQVQYVSGECSMDYYNQFVSRITTTFQTLSQEMIQLIGRFREAGLLEGVRIMEALQVREKEKLELTVKWQILVQKEKGQSVDHDESHAGGAAESSVSDMAAEMDKNQLRRRLAAVEGDIAELLMDFKFECEPILLNHSHT